ncbi:MAG: PglZ domain-containing protein [Solirubrobacteraceae bacterium]
MTGWLDARVSDLQQATSTPVLVVLDPHGLLPSERVDAVAETVAAVDWWSLRRCWELTGRHRTWDDGRLIIHATRDAGDGEHLPYDIAQSTTVVAIGWPVPPPWRALFSSLMTEPAADIVVDAAQRGQTTLALLERLFGVGFAAGSESGELAAVAALRARATLSDAAWELIHQTVTTSLAAALAQQPPERSILATRWESWLAGEQEDSVLRDAGPALLGLVTAGVLPRVTNMTPTAPGWAQLAAADIDVVSRATALLGEPPVSGVPSGLSDWSAVAVWMGTIRSLLSLDPAAPEEILRDVHERATALDDAFGPWLQARYGSLLQSAAIPPLTLHKVAPFLASRVADNARVLLIVLDGVGFAQWEIILEKTGISPLQQQACLAMLPSETTVSRQALLAGTTPDDFASSFHTTAKEEQRWRAFWAVNGVSDEQVRYHRVDGRRADIVPLSPAYQAIAVIISAVDKFMHGSAMLGDAQLAASVTTWCQQNYLTNLLTRAAEQGFETWLTADHGNVVATAGGAPPEGLKVERQGTRLRLYRSQSMRDASAHLGVAWTPPRLPPDVHVLFARHREGFQRHGQRVTHGGLSFEEVFVPLARLT